MLVFPLMYNQNVAFRHFSGEFLFGISVLQPRIAPMVNYCIALPKAGNVGLLVSEVGVPPIQHRYLETNPSSKR